MTSSTILSGLRTPGLNNERQQNHPLLKDGQIVFSIIKKQLPNQMAEVQIGEQRLIAKLSTPLSVGDRQWVQATQNGHVIELKAIAAPSNAGSNGKMVNSLLEHLGVLKTTEMRSLVAEMVKAQWPMNKQILSHASEWLSTSANKGEALEVIRLMMTKNLPFSQEVFSALKMGNESFSTSITAQLNHLGQLLQKEPSSPVIVRALAAIETVEAPFQKQIIQQVISNAIAALSDSTLPSSFRASALQLLQDMQVIPKAATLSTWIGQSMRASINDVEPISAVNQAIIQISKNHSQPSASKVLQNELQQLQQTITDLPARGSLQEKVTNILGSIEKSVSLLQNRKGGQVVAEQIFSTMIKGQALVNQMISADPHTGREMPLNELKTNVLMDLLSQRGSNQAMTQQLFTNALKSIQLKNSMAMPNSAESLLLSLSNQAENTMSQQFNGKMIESMMRQVFDSMGIDYEAKLARMSLPLEKITESLKPQLLGLINDPLVSDQTKDAAESILLKFNGQQLLSSENGPFQQIIYQLPFSFLGQQIDMTMQWTGHKRKNGKLDPDHARVLFYLNLSALSETVIDMQVQNRIISINIYNQADNLKELAEPFTPILKKNLEKMKYQLSSVQFISTKEIEAPIINPVVDQLQSLYSGVDIRI
ncbi:hypothetical protein [Jeotgalibacillus soli]|uniref:Flagellar hook-length control protein-like C-terminal domain-containing protein n=1 Tax=Jeotgalibacillus soli TaxID=889306 RepID=A0A0C2RSY8_9BACL|nr:hypothetical protein [Jeotgalibacillus soli]KIL44869.1 hypothetical protein KP78_24130 [Jeotgalibacillus soli]